VVADGDAAPARRIEIEIDAHALVRVTVEHEIPEIREKPRQTDSRRQDGESRDPSPNLDGQPALAQIRIEFLRQRSRPYLFSNTLAPAIVATSLKVLEILEASTELRDKLAENTAYFRSQIAGLGLNVISGEHPIVPIMLGDARLAQKMAEKLLEKGIYVIGFSYPVVPEGQARIRTQISAAHSKQNLDFAIQKIKEVKSELKI